MCVCLSVTPSTKSTNFGSRYLIHEFSERDEIWQLYRGGLLYITTQIGELWHGGVLLGLQNNEGCKKIVTLF